MGFRGLKIKIMKLYKFTYKPEINLDEWEELSVDDDYKYKNREGLFDTVKYFESKKELFEYMLDREKRLLPIRIDNTWKITNELMQCQYNIEQYENELKTMKEEK